MTRFVYKDRKNSVELGKVPLEQRSMFESMRDTITRLLIPTKCPKHGSKPRVTVILSVEKARFGWVIGDACCSSYIDVVKPIISNKYH